MRGARLLVFGCLARVPSKQCGLCLLTKLGLAHTARLFWRFEDGCLSFSILDAPPTQKAALLYSLPICTTSHDPG